MPTEWQTVPLCGLVEPDRGISYGIVQPGSRCSTGVPIVRVADIRDGRIATADPMVVAPTIEAPFARTRLRGGELLLTLVGTVGECAIVPEALKGWNVARAVAVIPVRKDVTARWVQLALHAPTVKHEISTRLNTTVQSTLNLRDVAQLPIVVPPPAERERIAHVLGTLDDKIAINRRMSETLEAMARLLFKSWFVDFDPVSAKTATQDIGLPLIDLFPSSLCDSELGAIPQGWQVRRVSDLADVVGGSTPSTERSTYWGGQHAWATPRDLSSLNTPVLLETERHLTDLGLAQIGSGLLPPGTVLLSSRAPIGYLAIAEMPMAINQGFIAMKPRSGVSSEFLLRWAEANLSRIVSRANGSTFQEISKTNFRPIGVVWPTPSVMAAFDRIARPLHRRVVSCERESRTLAALRDTLLPKLLSGALRVKDAERHVAAYA